MGKAPLIPELGRQAWWALAGYTVGKVGLGLTFPFFIIYLHDVRGIGLGVAGLLLTATSVAGVAAVPVSGWLTDRVGGRPAVMLALAVAAAGAVAMAAATGAVSALGASLLLGAGTSAMWNSLAVLLAGAVPPARRADVFGVAFGLEQLGLGAGAAIGGAVARVGDAHTFVAIYVAEGALLLAFAGILALAGRFANEGSAAEVAATLEAAAGATGAAAVEADSAAAADPRSRGYLALLADRPLLWVLLLNGVLALAYSAFVETAFPAWATGPARSTTGVVGAAYSASTFATVALQLFVLRYILAGRRRTRSIAGAALLFGAGPVVALLAGGFGGGHAAAGLLVGALVATGVANTLLQPSLYALINGVAPAAARGRYTAVFHLAWQAGQVMGPALAGAALGAGHGSAFLLLTAALCVGLSLAALRTEVLLPAAANQG